MFIDNATDWDGSGGSYSAANTIDGSLAWTSRWEASGSPVHLVLDLGSVQHVTEVEIYGSRDNIEVTIETAFDDGTSHYAYPAVNTIDGNLEWDSRWAAYDESSVNLTIQLEETTNVAIAWGRGDEYVYTFEIYTRAGTSGDWTKVYDDISSGQTDDFEVFDITDIDAQQIRIKSFGSTDNTHWTNIKEVMFYGATSTE